jgi:hypothetical protein
MSAALDAILINHFERHLKVAEQEVKDCKKALLKLRKMYK